jgi:hypothetical protein
MRSIALALFAGLALGSPAAAPSASSTHTFEPLTTDFHNTPVVNDQAAGDTKEIDYYVRVLWSGNGIGEIAKQYGFDTVNYADLETLKVLGIWTQEWAHVYGTRKPGPASADAR